MKILNYLILATLSLGAISTPLSSVEAPAEKKQNIVVVNFKKCVDESKLGKEEQANFEALRSQMEKSLEAKEKDLNELANKFNDVDYLDSLSPEAETELKRKFRQSSQEINQIQTQYYQTLSQANMKIIQKLQEAVVAASKIVAEKNNIDLIVGEENAFFYNPKWDISSEVISIMDEQHSKALEEAINAKHGENKS